MSVPETLDPLNRRLLRVLAGDPRMSVSELARQLGVSVPTARDRLRRLEETGVIRGYRVDIDPAALGYPVAVWVRLRPGPGPLAKLAQLADTTAEVTECHRISGEDCFLLRVQVPSIQALEGVLDRFLLYGQTTSSFVVATPVALRNAPIESDHARPDNDVRPSPRGAG